MLRHGLQHRRNPGHRLDRPHVLNLSGSRFLAAQEPEYRNAPEAQAVQPAQEGLLGLAATRWNSSASRFAVMAPALELAAGDLEPQRGPERRRAPVCPAGCASRSLPVS